MPKRTTSRPKQETGMASAILPSSNQLINAENSTAEFSHKSRAQIEAMIFKNVPPTDKFDQAARNSFMDCVMSLLKNGGRFIRL